VNEVRCQKCGTTNRFPRIPIGKVPICGKPTCKAPLPIPASLSPGQGRANWLPAALGIIGVAAFACGTTWLVLGKGSQSQPGSPLAGIATASGGERGASQAPTSVQGQDCRVNLSGFERLTPGMSYVNAAGLLGCPGREMSHSEHMGFSTAMYAWDGEGERALMSVLFQNDALAQKTQFGLK
jgi:hypothetical protein